MQCDGKQHDHSPKFHRKKKHKTVIDPITICQWYLEKQCEISRRNLNFDCKESEFSLDYVQDMPLFDFLRRCHDHFECDDDGFDMFYAVYLIENLVHAKKTDIKKIVVTEMNVMNIFGVALQISCKLQNSTHIPNKYAALVTGIDTESFNEFEVVFLFSSSFDFDANLDAFYLFKSFLIDYYINKT